MDSTTRATAPHEVGEPAWDIAKIFPPQGSWSEQEYLALETNRIVEFDNGYVEVPSMPTQKHQLIVLFLYRLLYQHVSTRNLGMVIVAAMRVHLWEGKYREPDIAFMRAENAHRRRNEYWEGADLVVEVVSPGADDRKRDLETKRQEYARASIPEYWIVDPETETVTVLQLAGDRYEEHGVFTRGETATSVLLDGFAVPVNAVFDVE